ncbi:MAG TPA: type II toxin-antitoxin system RelE/ParE family toxin [Brachybacterium massiliense]|uniref:Type II toxin-antitoxin system RelE/ParE family toxin n=1 Tax=Brachybacterium massiliense TaxID=1755098 RepID=A0A921MWI8_9MICO|nr:type II toxin-antitoxin system RelE/ParE family toxin [Brachybacterium massiliense]
MVAYRLSRAAEDDIVSILAWSQNEFGVDARHRYAALIAAALRDAAGRGLGAEPTARPELGPDVLSWHLARSRDHSTGGRVRQPRHVILCRWDGDVLEIGRVLHDSMDLRQHVERWLIDPA